MVVTVLGQENVSCGHLLARIYASINEKKNGRLVILK